MNKITNFLDGIVVFLYSVSLILFDRIEYINYFYFFQILLYINYFFRVIHRKSIHDFQDKISIGYFFFVLLSLFSLLWSYFQIGSFERIKTMFLILFNLYVFFDYLNKSNVIHYYIFGLGFAVIVNVLIYFDIIPSSDINYDSWRFQGTRDNPNYLAFFSVISIFYFSVAIKISKSLILKIFYWILIFLCFYLIFLTGSKKGILLGIPFLLLIIISAVSKIQLFLIVLLIYFIYPYLNIDLTYLFFNNENDISNKLIYRINEFLALEGTSTIQRIQFFEVGLNYFKENPFLGIGIGSIYDILGTYSHSNLIEILCGLGLVGFLIYYRLFYILAKSAKVVRKDLRIMFYLLIFILLIFDFAQVSYYYKFTLLNISIFYYMSCIFSKPINNVRNSSSNFL